MEIQGVNTGGLARQAPHLPNLPLSPPHPLQPSTQQVTPGPAAPGAHACAELGRNWQRRWAQSRPPLGSRGGIASCGPLALPV